MTINIKRKQDPLFLENAIVRIISPIQNFFTDIGDGISDLIDHYILLVNVSKENEGLEREIDFLVKQNNDLKEQLKRMARVSELIKYKEKKKVKSVVATIIGRDATQWSKMVFIDKGTNHGIKENSAVVTDAGVVGHIIQATGETSKVLLIIDGRSAVDALFQNTRISGIVAGTGLAACNMKYVPITAQVKEGDLVISSGLGGIFPKGLVVGTVATVKKTKESLFQDIIITPSSDLTRLEEVLVLVS
jgi:rod shape-determining protein MreC